MQLTSIETTPNPNSMKLNVNESVGKPVTYSAQDRGNCPDYVSSLLDIPGVQSLFVCQDFITLNRDPRSDWQPIIAEATRLLTGGKSGSAALSEQRVAAEKLGQVSVFVQTFRGIPIQVKIMDGQGEKRVALDSRFSEAAQFVQAQSGGDYLKERYWDDRGPRYGSLEEVASQVVDEIEGTLDTKAIEQLVDKALGRSVEATEATLPRSVALIKADLTSDDWHQRLAAVQELGTANDTIPILALSLRDPHPAVRRLVAAALGASGNQAAVEPLTQVLLNDSAVGVRRTAGDALSDLGDVAAQSAVCRALADANKLVRWRAARFLADVGTEEALPFLHAAANDPEFEVRLEIEAAIERITGGKGGSMPAWKKIMENTQRNS